MVLLVMTVMSFCVEASGRRPSLGFGPLPAGRRAAAAPKPRRGRRSRERERRHSTECHRAASPTRERSCKLLRGLPSGLASSSSSPFNHPLMSFSKISSLAASFVLPPFLLSVSSLAASFLAFFAGVPLVGVGVFGFFAFFFGAFVFFGVFFGSASSFFVSSSESSSSSSSSEPSQRRTTTTGQLIFPSSRTREPAPTSPPATAV